MHRADASGPLSRTVGIDRVEIAILRTDVDGTVWRDRRRTGYLIARRVRPFDRAVRIDGVEVVVIRADIDRAVICNRRG